MDTYPNNLKNWKPERVTIARGQGTSEGKSVEVKPTQLKTDSSSYLGIKQISPEKLAETVAAIRKRGQSIATLNGSFDLLHAGHLEIIYEAKRQADCLIMALNTDSSIKRYKSPSRPLISLEHRLQMVAALAVVDYVTWFDELDPCKVLSVIKPDVHVNGSEYGKECIEASAVEKFGGKIHIVPLVPGLSTSQIIEKIKNLS